MEKLGFGTEGRRQVWQLRAPSLLRALCRREAPATTPTLQILEKETLTLHMDLNTETFTIEGWTSLVPALPTSAAKYFRDITHGELRSLLDAFRSSPVDGTFGDQDCRGVSHLEARGCPHPDVETPGTLHSVGAPW